MSNDPQDPNRPFVMGQPDMVNAWQQQPPKKKRHVFRNIALVVGGLFGLLIVAAALSPNTPESAPPAAVQTVDNGPTPEPITTPTNQYTPTVTVPPKPKVTKPAMTKSQEQAVGAARSYLEFTAFSRKGLIKQLSSEYGEGFSVKDATFAVDYLKVNWNEQAAKAAKKYLEVTHFSRNGLIRQLESEHGEGFTHKQAVYGVTKAGL
jgi:hypothetical protein